MTEATWTMRIKLSRDGLDVVRAPTVDTVNALELSGLSRVGSDVTVDLSGSSTGPILLQEG